jgi:biofilm PGA synthesis N-glycosyltransferase PgaC
MTLSYLVFPRDVLISTDFDLGMPTLILMAFNFVYLFLHMYIYITYLFKIDKLKKNHRRISSEKIIDEGLCSIIIPARDEESVIKRAVLMCLEQTYKNIEVLVISHNSTDGTYEEALVDDKRVRAFDFKTKKAGKSIALNYGIEQSFGKYIMVLDADTVLEKDFIQSALPAFNDGKYVGVQGRVLPINRNYNLLTRLLAMEDDLWSEPILTTRTILNERCPLLGTGFILKKDILVQEGMFTNSLVDDYELTCKLLKKKYKIIFLPFCKAYAEEPPSLEVMLRQRARWGRGFINSLNHRMAESKDLVGNLLWLMPIGSVAGSIMFFIIAYASIFNIIFEYMPFTFTYIPLQLWFILIGTMTMLEVFVLLKVHGIRKGLKQSLLLLPSIMFSQYGLVVLFKALLVRTWGTTKTVHGFMSATSDVPVIEGVHSKMK